MSSPVSSEAIPADHDYEYIDIWPRYATDRYGFERYEDLEDMRDYKQGGFHPVHIGDEKKEGGYRILNKISAAGISTVSIAHEF